METFSIRLLTLDEAVDDVVLNAVHSNGEDEHHKRDLKGFIAFGPAQGPVADPWQPWQHCEEQEDEKLHTEQANKVNDGLLEPPSGAWWVAIITRLDRLWWVCDRSFREETV